MACGFFLFWVDLAASTILLALLKVSNCCSDGAFANYASSYDKLLLEIGKFGSWSLFRRQVRLEHDNHPTGAVLFSVRFVPSFAAVVRLLSGWREQEALRSFGLDEAHTFLEQARSLEVRLNDNHPDSSSVAFLVFLFGGRPSSLPPPASAGRIESWRASFVRSTSYSYFRPSCYGGPVGGGCCRFLFLPPKQSTTKSLSILRKNASSRLSLPGHTVRSPHVAGSLIARKF